MLIKNFEIIKLMTDIAFPPRRLLKHVTDIIHCNLLNLVQARHYLLKSGRPKKGSQE